ncbi:T9SS type A sorting domain-containing protein, partial [candidate division KSB1 bacterium]|nr:T9SS type A sorting domain-containing protein [candidate division KSB1 bacterium]
HDQINASEFKGSGTIYVENPQSGVFTGHNIPLVYDKAAFVLHMLRHTVGDSTFFKILKTYYADTRYQYNVASTEDFQQLCETVTGMDLDFFFQQWIFGEGYPHYEVSWNYIENNAGSYTVNGSVRQKETAEQIFKMPVDITIKMGGSDTTFVFWVDDEMNFFEFNVPQQPTDLVLDEENWLMDDTEYLVAPQLAVVFSEATELSGAGDGYPGANETAQVRIELLNTGAGISDLTAVLSTDDPDVTITKSESNFGTANSYQKAGNTGDPFEISLSADFEPHVVDAQLVLSGANNYQASIPAKLRVGKPGVLIVEDDGEPLFDSSVQLIFDDASILTGGVAADSLAEQNISMGDYSIVIWNTASDSTETLTQEDQQMISTFLENGGKFALFGENVGQDLVTSGDETDHAFYSDVLNAMFVNDNSGSSILRGVPGDEVGQGLILEMRTDAMQSLVESPDVISPAENGITFIQYLPSQASAAVRYENADSKVAYFGFGLNALAARAEENGKQLLANLVEWFRKTGTGISGDTGDQAKPAEFALHQNYPNPFSAGGRTSDFGTIIELSLPNTTQLEVTIYNLLGQKVRTLVNASRKAGTHQFTWNGLDDSSRQLVSGVYFVVMKTPEFETSRKILMVK